MANKPKIRFKGFDDAWEQRKLGDVVTFINGRAYSQEELLSNGKYKVLRVGNFYTNDSWYYSDMELEAKYYAKEGDLLYTWSATFGPHIWHGDKVIYHYHIWKVELSDALEKHFAVQLLEKDKQSILSDKNGSTMVHITKVGMESKEVMLPPNIREQTKIGECFQNLDHLITLHQRKCDQMKELKKYMLKKMFPQNGAKVPEIRFDGFTDDWEQRKFDEFVKNVAKRNKDNLDLEPYSVTNDRGFISQKDAHDDFGYMKDTDLRAYNIVPPNSFAYNPARINVGSLGYYTGTENVIVSSLYEVFQTEDFIDDRFLWHWLKSDLFPKWIEKLQEGSVRLYFYFDKLVQCQMMVPSVEEQKQIGIYFDTLDHLITLHQHKCNELREIKKYMLKNMFM